MPTAKQDIKDFNARIKRIKSSGNDSYYDPDLGMHIPKRVSRDKIKKKSGPKEDDILGPALVSVIIGAIAVMAAQVLRIRFFDVSVPDRLVFPLELLLTFWILLTLTALLKRRTVGARIAQVLGVMLMLTAGHNLIWRWPDQMAVVYTQAHVDEVMRTTEQHSIVVRGNVYGLPEPTR